MRANPPNCTPAKAGAQERREALSAENTPARAGLGPGLRRGTALATLPLLLTACSPPADLPAGPTPLDPIAFFTGVTTGQGTLDTLIARPVPVTVSSLGFREHGGLKLIQRIEEGEKPLRVRTWTMKPLGQGRYIGTLTDAVGSVTVNVDGPRATIGYHTPGGLRIRQQLALQPGGRSVLNRLSAYKYGLRVATLDEVISRSP